MGFGDSLNVSFGESSARAAEARRNPPGGLVPVRVALMRDVTAEPMIPYLEYFCLKSGMLPEIRVSSFGGAVSEALGDGWLKGFAPHAVFVILSLQGISPALDGEFLSLEDSLVDGEIAKVADGAAAAVRAARAACPASLIVACNFPMPERPALGILDASRPLGHRAAVGRLNERLAADVRNAGGWIADLTVLQSSLGEGRFRDARLWHEARIPFAREAWRLLAYDCAAFLRSAMGLAKKCLVLDADGTLWGGIAAEDGLAGIRLGREGTGASYRDFQMAILELHRRGVILALASKNNESDVMEILKDHPDMILREGHFAAKRVNWEDKAANVAAIADELGIATAHMVFVDDNPAEAGRVASALPEVETLLLPKDPSTFAAVLYERRFFDTLAYSREDRSRTASYRAEARRKAERAAFSDPAEYYASLAMRVTVTRASPADAARVAQLTQRTNQFNLTTRRYGEADVSGWIASPHHDVLTVALTDRFGDYGAVGAAILEQREKRVRIDTFLISCRVIGRGVEDALLKSCVKAASKRGAAELIAEYRRTPKNGLAADFYRSRGFTVTGETPEGTAYTATPSENLVTLPSYIAEWKEIL